MITVDNGERGELAVDFVMLIFKFKFHSMSHC